MVSRSVWHEMVQEVDDLVEKNHEQAQDIYRRCAMNDYKNSKEEIKRAANNILLTNQKIYRILVSMKDARIDDDTFPLSESTLREKNSMDDFDSFLSSERLESFLAKSQCLIKSTSRQLDNGTLVLLTPGKKEVQLSKAGYLRVPNETGEGNHLLNKQEKGGAVKMTYDQMLDKLSRMYDIKPNWFEGAFNKRPNWNWEIEPIQKYRKKYGLEDVNYRRSDDSLVTEIDEDY